MTEKKDFKRTVEIRGVEKTRIGATQNWADFEAVINTIPRFPNGDEHAWNQIDVLRAVQKIRRAHLAGQAAHLNSLPAVFGLHETVARLLATDQTPPPKLLDNIGGFANRVSRAAGTDTPPPWHRVTQENKPDKTK